jgi:hypothetical protein
MNKLKIDKTGNFWIDNGIVGLYKIISATQSKDCCEITASGLVFSFDEEGELTRVLNKAREAVVGYYLKKTGNSGWILKEGAFEIYDKTDFKRHLKPFFTGKTPKTEGALMVPDTKEDEAGGKVRRMTNAEYKLFQIFKDNNTVQPGSSKKLKIENKGFMNTPPAYEIGGVFKLAFLEEGKKICSFSGKAYKLADIVTGMDYPFLTGKSGELNFSSFLEGKPQLSALYSFVSLFSFYNLNYLLQDDMKHYFVLYDGNLESLSEFSNTITTRIEHLSKPDFCSFETEIIGSVYESEALFNFLLSTYNRVKLHFEGERYDADRLFTKSVFTLSNDGNIFRNVKEYTSITDLFDLFEAFAYSDDQSYFNYFKNFVRAFTQKLDGGKYNTIWRDRLCNEILNFRNISKTVEAFLGDVRMREGKGVPFLDKIIKIYYIKTQANMNAEMVDLCKSLGNRIGAYCRQNDDKGILFSIRNSRNRSEFLNILAETQFRTEVRYSEIFFKELPDNAQWEEYKSLVSIFAMNSFLYKELKSKTEAN